jgi:signal transduction histidine kinase
LTDDLVRSRERIITATEEERRRLRRDLHDGLGPTLAGVVLGLHRARSAVEVSPAAATEQLTELCEQVQEAVAEVRRLVYGLRPPTLDELGLVGGLEEQARMLGVSTTVVGSEGLALPAAVEVAAYRIAVEAMTNAARHASARHCEVAIRLEKVAERPSLMIDVADDGTGVPDSFRAGVGISSMRERASELGGSCAIERRPQGGTRVLARIPLADASEYTSRPEPVLGVPNSDQGDPSSVVSA